MRLQRHAAIAAGLVTMLALTAVAASMPGLQVVSDPQRDGPEGGAADDTSQAGAATTAPATRAGMPVVLLHGYAFGPGTGGGEWDVAIRDMVARGLAGPFERIALYACDGDAHVRLDGHGAHDDHHGLDGHRDRDGCGGDRHDQDTDIRHLGMHLAWYLHDRHPDACVAVVGHSMGGLVARAMLADASAPAMPPTPCVRAVVTLGTPHAGAPFLAACAETLQCRQMLPGSTFLTGLGTYAPQGPGGTTWSLIGSDADALVPALSALAMQADEHVRYDARNGIGHAGDPADYLSTAGRPDDALVHVRHGDAPERTSTGPFPIGWAAEVFQGGVALDPPPRPPEAGAGPAPAVPGPAVPAVPAPLPASG